MPLLRISHQGEKIRRFTHPPLTSLKFYLFVQGWPTQSYESCSPAGLSGQKTALECQTSARRSEFTYSSRSEPNWPPGPLELTADEFTSFTQLENCQKRKGKQGSQLGGHLSRTLWQLVQVEVKADVTLQAEEAAVAGLLKDRLCFEFSRLAEKHQQVPIQKPGSTGRQSSATLAYFFLQKV